MIDGRGKQAFLLKCADIIDKGRFLKIYDDINNLYRSWGEPFDVDVEVSVKVASGKVNYNRYILPITREHASDEAKMDQVMRAVDSPKYMFDIARTLHANRVSAMVGFDHNSDGRKIYFYHGEKGFGYEFKDSSACDLKIYRLVQRGNYRDVLKGICNTLNSDFKKESIRKIIPLEEWAEVCEMKRFSIDDKRTTYDISTYESRQLWEISSYLLILVEDLIEGDEKRKFISWLYRNTDIYLHWLGIGVGEDGETVITFYVRSEA